MPAVGLVTQSQIKVMRIVWKNSGACYDFPDVERVL